MYQIRFGIPETNSSSSHSLQVCGSSCMDTGLFTNSDGYAIVSLGEYGWGPDTLDTPDEKLSYIVTMAVNHKSYDCTDKVFNTDTVLEDPQFLEIQEAVIKAGYKGLVFDKKEYGLYDFYIDHQSDYQDIHAFLKDYGNISVYDFIFDIRYIMLIDNDNCPYFRDEEEEDIPWNWLN